MESSPNSPPSAVAIIGMAGRFPGAGDIESFWENIAAGIESITFFSEQELRATGVEPELLADPAYVRARSVVTGAELFDAAFFDVSPREAEVLDPQHRLLLECSWEALERAGYDPGRFPGPIGVFAGASINTYLLSNLQHNPEVMGAAGLFQAMVGNCGDFLATRISYKLGLRGPSLTVQTACSTSLVAVHLAVQSLLNSECDMALAGGVRVLVPRKGGHLYQPGGIFSRDGHCRAFDATATGTTEGEGCGLVVLKRLSDALMDGDHIHAVILGSAINNDGSAKMGYTMPSIEGQAEVIAMAQALAGIDPGSIGFIEAHGTGTPLGDPIEVAALSRVFMAAEPGLPCALGSLKSNLGHLDTAAGVASLVKVALAVEHGLIPPSLHFEKPNPQIDFASGSFYVPVQPTPWPGDGPRRAGVSSYGFGGTNAHVVLEEAPKVPAGSGSRSHHLLVLSAPTLPALETITRNLAEHLRRHPQIDLADVVYTLQIGRVHFDHRRIVVCKDAQDAVEVLSTLDPKRVLTRTREAGERAVFFLFPGQGSQHPGMGEELYRGEPVFREEVDRCAEILRPSLGLDLRQVLYPEGGRPEEAAERLQQTALAQPALFVIEHALARLWMSWGITPQAMLGHSIGEYVAACLAGVLSLEDALRLVVERGRLMQEMPGGAMLAVPLPEAEVRPLLGRLSLAAINGPSMCVASGESGEIDDLAARLVEGGVQVRRLHTSHAFHSAAMEPVLERFEASFEGLCRGPLEIPFVSNLTGTWIRPEEAASPHYWARHLRETVRFSDGLEVLFARPSSVFLEVGPGQALTSLVRQHPNRPAASSMLACLPSAGDGRLADAASLRALGQLWMAGVEIDWAAFSSTERRLRVPLPTYPFERQRYWVEPASGMEQLPRRVADNARELDDWFWVPLWRQALPSSWGELPDGVVAGAWLVFTDETGLGDRLAERLRERGGKVATVRAGEGFEETNCGNFVIRPGEAADYGALLDRLAEQESSPERIVHLWSVAGSVAGLEPAKEAERHQERGLFSLLHLAQALGDRRQAEPPPPLQLGILSTGVHRITGAEDLTPARATLLGLAATLPQEYLGVACVAIDLVLLPPGSRREKRLLDLLITELTTSKDNMVVAYRGTERWLRTFEPLRLESSRGTLLLRESGTYLITGGLGRVGLELAGFLARSVRGRLVLSSRASFPKREEWSVLAQGEDRTAWTARRLLDLEAAGAEVWVAEADVTDETSMRCLFGKARQRFGRIDGVIHAAGVAGGGLMQSRSCTEAEAVLAPKVRGTLVLEELLAGDPPDFWVLCSSLDSLVGGPGQFDSRAADAFLDAFAQSRAGDLPVLSINWSPWRPVLPRNEELSERMDPEQAVEAFRRILVGGPLPQIAVSVRPLPDLLDRMQSMAAGPKIEIVSPKASGGHARPDLETPYVAPRGELETQLAAIWGDVLGLERVGTADGFFELGGHSLLGTQLVARVRDAFGVEIPLGQLFEASTVADFAVLINAQHAAAGASGIEGISQSSRGGEMPLSFAQERFWFLDQLAPGGSDYNMPMVLRVRGALDLIVTQAVLGEIVRRHEALRTTFRATAGEPKQIISSSATVLLPVIDLGGLPAEGRERETEQLSIEEAYRPFDLARGPLLRAAVLSHGTDQCAVLLNMHHIVSDAWSLGIFVQEFGTLYAAFLEGRPSPLPKLATQYADFAAWQRQHLSGAFLEAELAWWRNQLAGMPPALEMPMDHPRSMTRSHRGAAHDFAMGREDLVGLVRLSRSHGATLFMTLLSGFAALLQRVKGEDDLAVGGPIAGRTRVETESLIGLFINTLVLRIDLSGNPDFVTLLGRVRETTLSAYAHQELPFERIVEDLAPERNFNRSPLVQLLFSFQNTPMTPLELPGLTVTPSSVPAGATEFELICTLLETERGLEGKLEYSRDLFEDRTIERLAEHLMRLLRVAASNPQERLSEVSLLSQEESEQLLVEWSGRSTFYPRETTIHDLFAEQAALSPDAVAVTGAGESLSYAELERRAAYWAQRLRSLGVAPEVRVGICLDRSPARVMATLAVLMAGGVYVPLDPSYPRERLAFLVRDSGASVLVTEERWLQVLPQTGAAILYLDQDERWEESVIEISEVPQVSATSLAYVMYTSGSTGEPKGVAVPHRSVVRLVRDTGYARFGPDEVFLQLAPYAFDASTLELWGALLNGGCLVMPPPGVLSPTELGDFLKSYGVTTLWLTAGLFHQMVDENLQGLAGVRQLLAGGDVLSVPHAQRVLAELPGTRLINGYGPTENTTFTCCYPVADPASLEPSVPLGRPIANTWVYVLDRNLIPVPVGVAGELFAGGDGLARGYLARPERTAERFLPDPFGREAGGRLYRTGDLARWRSTGELEYLGRIDTQVKVRGFRVEPGEIEAALLAHPHVHQAVVIAVGGAGADRSLAAYLVGREGDEPDPSELRTFLRERLPDFMLPAVYVSIPELPLTSHGKVDRKALAELRPKQVTATTGAKPRTPAEELLAAIFAEILGLERVGIEEDFFGLGGHSLLATRLVSRLREVFGREIPLRLFFESPTVAKLAERIASLDERPSAPPMQPVPRDRNLPLSFAQQRLWLIDQLDPGNPAYNIPLALRLTGEIKPELLQRIFSEIVRRHETLRTTFTSGESGPVQVIAAPEPLELPLLDLSHLPASRREAQARALALSEARHPFDLQRGPLLRLFLVRLAERDHLLLLALHHIVSDGWSLGVLLQEIVALHDTFSQGLPSPLAELPVQYADFAAWQRQWLQGEVLNAQLAYWKQRLAGAPAVLELPLDRPRPAVQTFRGATRPLHLGPGLSDAVRDLCRREGTTPFMALLAALAVLLGRHAGQDDVLVGAPIAGRNRREIEGLIGFFVNTLVLRSDLSGAPSFGEVLDRVRQTALDAFTHQDLPFERIVEEVVVERNLAISPLFQVLFTLQNAPLENLEMPGLVFSPLAVDTGLAKFDLSLTLQEGPEGFMGTLEHSADLFDGTTVERLLTRFVALLETAIEDPSLRVADLPVLLPWERQQTFLEWNDTVADYPGDRCLHELIAEQARRTPSAVALAAGQAGADRLTFAALDAAAEQLAARLRSLGVGPEAVVALYLERSAALGVAVLAALKAGGAFLPIDLSNPRERLAWVLQDAGPRVVLTVSGLAPRLPVGPDDAGGEGPHVICLDLPAGPEAVAHRAELPVTPDNLAYVIYTSGSTGRPKGTMIPHRGVVNYLSWAVGAYAVEAGCGAPVHTSLSFDLTLTSLLAPWLAGRCALLVPEGEGVASLGLALAGLPPAETGFSLVKLTPAHLQLLAEQPGAVAAGRTRVLVVGGEALFGESLEAWRLAAPATRVVNEYGPTETVVGCCVYEAPAGMLGYGPVPIGRPIDNSRLYVVDGQLRPVPLGTPGELMIGGVGLARGYLRRPGLTAERFIPDALGGAQGGRLYRTGDRVRQRPDGILEYLGRMDHQVKIRGFRIELGEIETVLASHPSVRECALLVREDAPGSRLLVAYTTLDPESKIQDPKSELRSFLGERLPDYMVPSAVVVLDALPLSSNGKVERRALPAPEWSAAASSTVPRTPVEEVLAGIFSEVLSLERVGVEDDFFGLGGHSLLATRLVSRLREVFGHELPLRLIFEAPTVAALAERIGSLCEGPSAPPIRPVPRTGDLPLSFAQQRLWFLDRLSPDNPFYNTYGAVRLTGSLDVDALRRAFQEIVRRHEALRTTFRVADNRPIQVIAPMPGFEVPLVDLESLAAAVPEDLLRAELTRLSNDESLRPFDLSRGPLFRASLVRLAAREHTLLVNLHHIISDGWSMGVLLRELATLYRAFSQGAPSPLAELPIQYADFAVWQRQWLQGERLEAELDYWRRQLAGIPEVLELPYDHPRPAIESFRGSTQSFALPVNLVRELTALTRRHGATVAMTMLAGFKVLLARYSGREDVAVGVAIANRTRREIESLIGFFVNTLVVRSDLADSLGFARLLARVRETALEAYAHQDLPFEYLVEELQPERDLSRNPLIQVMFSFQNFPRADAEIQGLVLSSPEGGQIPGQTAKFDLTLFLFEDGGLLKGLLEYNSDLFEATTMQRLLGHFGHLLTAAVAQPGMSVAFLPLLTDAEIHQLVREGNAAGSAGTSVKSLQELFEDQVRRNPYAPALFFGESILSYGELNRRANRLAHRLLQLGVGPESRVGLCLERSPELIVALLGILKAGGGYVPLDPDYPRERLAFLVEDSGLRVLIGEETALQRLPEHLVAAAEVVLPCADPKHAGAGGREDDPPVTTSGDNLAYVIYTSGSTGRPKGVAVTHANVVRLLTATASWFSFDERDVWTLFHSSAFDFSVWEIWGALAFGGRLVVVPRDVSRSPEDLYELLSSRKVTVLNQVPSVFRQVVIADAAGPRPLALRLVIFGGEALEMKMLRPWFDRHGDACRLVNMYGITETTVHVTYRPVTRADLDGPSMIGQPIPDLQIHLLDRWMQPVPAGVPGEIFVGGAGLARGYLHRPDLTAERFVPDPFGAPGGRLYRSGDLARRRLDVAGQLDLESLGRIDQQVKIRGFRIELGEIESRLGDHPAVLQNVLLAREDIPGDRRLVAYVVQNPAYEAQENGTQTEQVSQWGEIFDDLYLEAAADSNPTFNTIGWNSSYTDLPLPGDEMEEWLADTVGRIAALSPRRVLEIGCGTGMILFRIAPRCELYTGIDFSSRALGYIESQLGRLGHLGFDRSQIQLLQGSAERLDGIEPGSFDTVIVNSVAQYFPSADYLAEVIARAVEAVRPGGSIFLGDLRSLPLLDAFHTSLELFLAEPEMPLPRLRQKVHSRRQMENELVIAPAFFTALRQRLPQIGRVEVHPKQGLAHNELTAFRYQVVLRLEEVRPGVEGPNEVPWWDWQGESLTVATLRQRLEEGRPEIVGLHNIPNARVAEACAAARLLREVEEGRETGIRTAGDLRRRVDEAVAGAIEPQDLWDLSLDLPYEIELGWASPGSTGSFEAVLRRCVGTLGSMYPISFLLPEPQVVTAAFSRYTNNPLQGRFARRIAPELKAFLQEQLPEYMVPSAFVLLDALPLSPNGKIDRRRLPAPDSGRLEIGRALVAPRSATEVRLVEIWKELLGTERVGVNDDFFELGGHSLLATQAMSRVREVFGVELPLRTFFEAPSVAAVAAAVDGKRLGDDAVLPISPVSRDGMLPLSFAQERLWFLSRLTARTLVYNESAAFRMEGYLDMAAFRWSLDEVVRRHESLRTTFPEHEGWAAQQIHPPAPFGIPSVDLRGLQLALREREAGRLATEQARHPFDLALGPLVRGLLIRLDESEHAVLLFFHHIVFDGWSTAIFVRELSALYRSRIAGETSPLPPLPIQYADFAVWQRQWLQGEVLENQLSYWRERLAGVAVLDLPTDHSRQVRSTAVGGWLPIRIAPDLTRRLRALSRSQGTTLFMTFLAALQALLHHYTWQDDIAVGTPIANRTRGELEDLIGFFVNMLVLRTDLSGNPVFSELVARVREVALGAYAHQDLPFEKLVAEVQPDRGLRHNPLFQIGFQLLNLPPAELDLPGLSLHPFPFMARSAKFDLNMVLTEEEERISGVIDYDSALFEAPTIDRLIRHFEALLAAAAADPTMALSDLPLLSPWERHQLLAEWGGLVAEPSAQTLHGRFEMRARQAPESPAVTVAGRTLSYGELNRRSNQLAHRLRELGVGPDRRVALCLERSPDLVVGILGILKAGGAYVPLDPGYPRERLAFMIEDAGIGAVIGTTRSIHNLPGTIETILLDTHGDLLESLPSRDLEPSTDGTSLAYVIYTSGSTGHPKGALVGHANAVRLFDATSEWFGFGEQDAWTLFHSYTFDFSVWEIWGALLYGGRLVVVPYDVSRSPELFLDLLAAERITVLNQTPSAFAELARVDEERGGVPTDLRLVIFGGEALDIPGLAPWFARHGDEKPQLVNMYGITETTVHVTYRPLRVADTRSERRSVIGIPIPDLSLHVLDPWLRPAPIGVPGELVVGGAGLARGYLNRPELTAGRFVPDPSGVHAGARLYRSGDLGRFLPNGDLEYLGRIDHQVKIRGFRIELGEIQAALEEHPAVRQAVVLPKEEPGGERRLVAFLVAQRGSELAVEELRTRLARRLPDYMVPAGFIIVEDLPLTRNGKVDRKALLSMAVLGRDEMVAYEPPRNPVQQALVEVWQEVLRVERIGIDDRFFSLGGDSILSIRVCALARARGLSLSLDQIFEHQTVRELSEAISGRPERSDEPAPTKPFELLSEMDRLALPEALEDAYPLAALQTGMLFHSGYTESSTLYQNVTSLRLEAPFDGDALRDAIRQLLARHPVLRTSFDLSRFSEPLQLVYRRVEPPLEVEDLRGLSPEDRDRRVTEVIEEERHQKLDETVPPLLRFRVHLLEERVFQLTWTEHHAILDGWSVAALTAELFRLYRDLRLGRQASPLPAAPVAFRDFVALERRSLESEKDRRFWLRKLEGAPRLRLPRRSGRQEGQEPRMHSFGLSLEAGLAERLQRLAGLLGVPAKNVLLAAHYRVLGATTGQADLVSGLVVNGRPEAEGGDRVLGLFLNTIPLRLQLAGGTWKDLIRQTFETEQELSPFRRYPMADLQRRLGGGPLFETAFNYVHFHILQGLESEDEVRVLASTVHAETNLPFNISFLQAGAALGFEIEYDETLFDAAQAEAIACRYSRALELMTAGSEEHYDARPLLSEPELHQLLSEWNDTRTSGPAHPVHELFELRALAEPEAVAVIGGETSLTYGELRAKAWRLAGRLRSFGVGPEVRVGLLLDRSADLIVGILGILQAGGACLPLDPENPEARLRHILEDSRTAVLVTSSDLAWSLPSPGLSAALIDRDDEESSPKAQAGSSGDLAYVIYTSGSTGAPKGVLVGHGPLANAIGFSARRYGLTPGDRVLQFASISFDASLEEIFSPLVSGAAVVLRDNAMLESPRHLLKAATDLGITVLSLPTAYWHKVVAALAAGETRWPSSVRLVVIGGERARAESLVKWSALGLERVELINVYGPTEATIGCTHAGLQDLGAISESAEVPIGRPYANARVYLLGSGLQPVPPGGVGELHVGGDVLARGYLGLPGLTAERFLPDPFHETPGARMYRTGDLAASHPDGTLEFRGRVDSQMKIRGFRIELGEIEAALSRHPGVREAVVLALESEEETVLSGYIVPGEPRPASGELHRFLREQIPAYMIPPALVFLDQLPLTVNGKLDTEALPAPEQMQRPERDSLAPRDTLELQLVRLWEDLLGIRPIGVREDFFELGGHSLVAVQLVARLQKSLGVSLSMATLLRNSTIERLAAALRDEEHSRSTLVELASGEGRPFFCIHAVGGEVFGYIHLARGLAGRPIYGLQAAETGMAEITLEEMAARYILCLREVQPVGPYSLGGWSMGGVIAFEMARQLEQQGKVVDLLVLIDSFAPNGNGHLPEAVTDGELVGIFAHDLARLLGVGFLDLPSTFGDLAAREALAWISAEATRSGLLPPGLDGSEWERRFAIFKANSRALDRYAGGHCAAPAILFKAVQPPAATNHPEPESGWGRLLTRPIEVHDLPGDHYNLLQRPQVEKIAALLRERLSCLS